MMIAEFCFSNPQGEAISVVSALLPSTWARFQLAGKVRMALRRVPPSRTWSYSMRSHAVEGSSPCSSAAFLFSSAALDCCSSWVAWPPQAASAAAEPTTPVPARKRRRVLVIFMGFSLPGEMCCSARGLWVVGRWTGTAVCGALGLGVSVAGGGQGGAVGVVEATDLAAVLAGHLRVAVR